MRNQSLRMSVLMVVLFAAGVAAQAPPPTGDARFTGRWELQMLPPAGVASQPFPFALVEIATSGGTLGATFISTPVSTGKVTAVSVNGDVLTLALQLDVMGQARPMTLTGKRIGDRLEFSGSSEGIPTPMSFIGLATTKETLTRPGPSQGAPAPGVTQPMPPPPPDRQALNTAMSKPREQRAEALAQFLKDFPDSTLRESATLLRSQNLGTVDERVAALRQFITDFPKSADEGDLQIAVASADKADRIAGLRNFLVEHPESPLKARAESALKRLTSPPGDPSTAAPMRVGGNIRPPVKLVDVKPVYPLDAQQGRVQGVVIIEARIDEAGNVTNARILRSIPMLDQAALDAVTQWKFSPTEMDGAPVPVIMTVTVNFTLQ